MTELATTGATNAGTHDLIAELHAFAAILRRRWQLVAVCVAIALTVAVIYLARTRRLYEATTQILVLQQGARPLNVGGSDVKLPSDDASDLLATHAMVVSSPLVVGRAIKAVGLENLPSLTGGSDDPIETAIKNLKVSLPDRLARVLEIKYRAQSPAEAVSLVEAISESYRKFLEDTYQKNSGEVISLITKARDELGEELEKLEAEYIEFRRSKPALLLGPTGNAIVSNRLDHWNQASGESRIQAVRLRSQLELGRTLASEGAELWAIAHAIAQVGGNSESLSATLASRTMQTGTMDHLRQLEAEMHRLADQHGPNYSGVLRLQEQISQIRQRSRALQNRIEESEVKDLLGAIEHSLKAVEGMRTELEEGLGRDQSEAKQVEEDILIDENLRGNLERHRALFNTVVDQLKQAQFVSDYDSISSETIEPAHAKPNPVHPRLGMTLALALFAGLAVGSASAFVADRLDQRIRSLGELRRLLGVSMLGHIPLVREEQKAEVGEFGLICHRSPRSPWAEAYRTVRTNIEFLRRNGRAQLLVITSPHSGDGKSVSASNLAISLASAGRRVLLIDGDLRKPSQHKIHGLPQSPGLTHVLRDLLSVEKVVKRTSVDGLDLIATGPQVANPAELMMAPRFAEFLREVRDRYDTIIYDTSPLLAVSDPLLVGAMADGVVLVVRVDSISHHEADRVVESLKGLETPIFGAVINRATRDQTGYGYGYGTYGEDPTTASPEAAEPASKLRAPKPEPSPRQALVEESTNGHVYTNDLDPH